MVKIEQSADLFCWAQLTSLFSLQPVWQGTLVRQQQVLPKSHSSLWPLLCSQPTDSSLRRSRFERNPNWESAPLWLEALLIFEQSQNVQSIVQM